MSQSKPEPDYTDLQFEVDLQSFADHAKAKGAVTVIEYRYTDATNCKQNGTVKVDGVVGFEVLAHLSANMFDHDGFLPSQLGMPKLQSYEYVDDIDHEIHTIEQVVYAASWPEESTPVVGLDSFTQAIMKLDGEDSWDIGAAMQA